MILAISWVGHQEVMAALLAEGWVGSRQLNTALGIGSSNAQPEVGPMMRFGCLCRTPASEQK